MIHGVKREKNMFLGFLETHKKVWSMKKNLWTMTTNPLTPHPVVGSAAVKDSMVFFKGFPYVDGKKGM